MRCYPRNRELFPLHLMYCYPRNIDLFPFHFMDCNFRELEFSFYLSTATPQFSFHLILVLPQGC